MKRDDSQYRIQYPYATDENGVLTYIGDVGRERRHEHSFVCPNCGVVMLPRLGEHNAHCFAHDKDGACGKESYIHKTAKEILARRFNENDSFPISFTTKCKCGQAGSCNHFNPDVCTYYETKEYDLKKHYDLPAVTEHTIISNGAEFRPDVILLSSDKRRNPVFLEVYFKHKSSEEKIANNQCIEFRVRDFSDLHNLENGPIRESEKIAFLNFKDRMTTPEQIVEYIRECYGAQDVRILDRVLPYCKQSRESKRHNSEIRRFTLFKSGKSFENGILEDEFERHHPSSMADVTYRRPTAGANFSPAYLLAQKCQGFRTCKLCSHCISHNNQYDDKNTWCELGKNGSTKKGTFNPLNGSRCAFFEWADRITQTPSYATMLEDIIEGEDYSIWIAPDMEV